jgi:hypothetical protein
MEPTNLGVLSMRSASLKAGGRGEADKGSQPIIQTSRKLIADSRFELE